MDIKNDYLDKGSLQDMVDKIFIEHDEMRKPADI